MSKSADESDRPPPRRVPASRTSKAPDRYFVRLHPVKTERSFDPARLPVRSISGEYWRHTAAHRHPLDMPERALASARYHRKGQQPRIYAASTRDTAWGELFRHSYGVSPFETKRRMAKIAVTELPVLDLTNACVCRQLGVTEPELTSNRHRACQLIADLVRRRPDRFGGILAPSAADPYENTLVIFAEWREGHVRVVDARAGRPPLRLLGLFERIIGTLPPKRKDEALAIARQLRREVTRRRGPRP